jgi:hypothetical protein
MALAKHMFATRSAVKQMTLRLLAATLRLWTAPRSRPCDVCLLLPLGTGQDCLLETH